MSWLSKIIKGVIKPIPAIPLFCRILCKPFILLASPSKCLLRDSVPIFNCMLPYSKSHSRKSSWFSKCFIKTWNKEPFSISRWFLSNVCLNIVICILSQSWKLRKPNQAKSGHNTASYLERNCVFLITHPYQLFWRIFTFVYDPRRR